MAGNSRAAALLDSTIRRPFRSLSSQQCLGHVMHRPLYILASTDVGIVSVNAEGRVWPCIWSFRVLPGGSGFEDRYLEKQLHICPKLLAHIKALVFV